MEIFPVCLYLILPCARFLLCLYSILPCVSFCYVCILYSVRFLLCLYPIFPWVSFLFVAYTSLHKCFIRLWWWGNVQWLILDEPIPALFISDELFPVVCICAPVCVCVHVRCDQYLLKTKFDIAIFWYKQIFIQHVYFLSILRLLFFSSFFFFFSLKITNTSQARI